jgi:hypothetical protein
MVDSFKFQQENVGHSQIQIANMTGYWFCNTEINGLQENFGTYSSSASVKRRRLAADARGALCG